MNSRQKGAAAERLAAALLSDLLGQKIHRRLGQARDSGHDLTVFTGPDEGIAVEVKRQERASLHTWLTQAEEAAQMQGEKWLPAVMWRPSRRTWVVAMPLEDWCQLVREAMK